MPQAKDFITSKGKRPLPSSNNPSRIQVSLNHQMIIVKKINFIYWGSIVHRALSSSNVYLIRKERGEIERVVVAPFYIAKKDHCWKVSKENIDFYSPQYSIASEVYQSIRSSYNPSSLTASSSNTVIQTPGSPSASITASGSILSSSSSQHIQPEYHSHQYQSDIWSFGILLFQLLTLSEPYSECNSFDHMIELMKTQRPSLPSYLSDPSPSTSPSSSQLDNLIDIFHITTNVDPSQRPPIKEIVKSLSSGSFLSSFHSFFPPSR